MGYENKANTREHHSSSSGIWAYTRCHVSREPRQNIQ